MRDATGTSRTTRVLLAAVALLATAFSPLGVLLDPVEHLEDVVDDVLEVLEHATVGARLAQALQDDPLAVGTVAVALDDLADTLLLDAVADLGLEVVAQQHLPTLVVRGPLATVALVGDLPGVRGLWLDAPLDLAMAETRGLLGVDAVQADLGLDGAGVTIAVMDSGIEATHPDLAFGSKVVQNVEVLGFQGPGYDGPLTALALPVEDLPTTDLVSGHGTHVAGIAAGDGSASGGRLRGVAPGASLVGVSTGEAYLVTTLAGYDWILEHREEYGIRVLNNSWSDSAVEYDPAHPLNLASRAAVDAGIVVVQAAGNDGQASGDVLNRYAPPWVLTVGAVDKLGRAADYSARGTAERHADVVAPGSFVAAPRAALALQGSLTSLPLDATDPAAPRVLPVEEVPYYTYKQGTSMAAPHVAGVVALLLEAVPGLTPAQVEDALVASARPVVGCEVEVCGAGLVDAVAAVAHARSLAVVPPVATLVADPAIGAAPLTTTLDASGSSDPDGSVVAWEWDDDADGEVDVVTETPLRSVTFAAGVHRVAVVAVDDDGRRSLPALVEVRASDPPRAVVDASSRAGSGETVVFDASASSDPDGEVVAYRFDLGDGTVIEQSSPVLEHAYEVERPVLHAWRVTAVDDAGLSDTVGGSIRVTPRGR